MKRKDNKVNYKKIADLYFIAAICFYFAALLNFTRKDGLSMGVPFLCLGSTMLCLGSVWLNKNNEQKNMKKRNNKKN